MSGRFIKYPRLEALKAFFPIDKAACEVTSNLNIAPSQEMLAIIRDAGENWLVKFHWGLVPFWAKDVSIGNGMINARAESIAEKPSFRDAFQKRRCLIPADGFYEWTGKKDNKQPVFITLPDRKPFAFAGLWETWGNKDDENSLYKSCTIITTQASKSFRVIHHRMPVILEPAVYEPWLDPRNHNAVELVDLLNNEIITEFLSYPVSKRVSSIDNTDRYLIETVGKPQQTELNWPEYKKPSPKN